MSYFFSLPLRFLFQDQERLNKFVSKKLNPELGLCAHAIDECSIQWHSNISNQIKAANLKCSIHLPFMDLNFGSSDPMMAKSAVTRMKKAFEIAKIYQPQHLIAHAGYDFNFYAHTYSQWAERERDNWLEVLHTWPNHPPLYLENTFEKEPQLVTHLIDLLRENISNEYKQTIGMCFDIGHWFSFAQGKTKKNLADWIASAKNHIRHLHLHDNDGSFDQHLGLGNGQIPWVEAITILNENSLHPTITFEPHVENGIETTLNFLNQFSLMKNYCDSKMETTW